MIPFSPPYIDDETILLVTDTLQSGWITTGPRVKELEQQMTSLSGVSHCLAVNSATSAMMLVLHWYGVSRGDEVIIPAYTYCATALAAMHIGATPVMVDIQKDFTIDPQKIKAAITSKTKAIITVDFAGWPCDYDTINKIVNSNSIQKIFIPKGTNQQQLGRILVLSDAAHALGAIYKNKPIGQQADITIFSMHAVKNVTTAEGGVIAINLPPTFTPQHVYDTLRLWSLNGQTKDAYQKTVMGGWRYDIVYPGFKMNMPDVLAAIGIAQLKKYKENLLPARKQIMDTYNKIFSAYTWATIPPFKKKGCSSSYHLYPLQIKNCTEKQRDKIIHEISKMKVGVNVHFVPLPLLTVFKDRGYKMGDYPDALTMYQQEISLPIYPQLTKEDCMEVANAVIQSVTKILKIK